jgi:hypothetical protein
LEISSIGYGRTDGGDEMRRRLSFLDSGATEEEEEEEEDD